MQTGNLRVEKRGKGQEVSAKTAVARVPIIFCPGMPRSVPEAVLRSLVYIFMVIFALLALPAHAINDPLDIAGCVLWLDATDSSTVLTNGSGTVTNWQDKSSGGNDARIDQGQANGDPIYVTNGINGKASVQFDGVQDVLDTLGGFTMPYTVLYVARWTGGDNNRLLSSSSEWSLGWQQFGDYDDFFVNSAEAVFNGTGGASTTGMVQVGRSASPWTDYYIDGSLIASNNAVADNINDLRVGGFHGVSDIFCGAGNISEVVIYNSVLSPSDHNDVGFYLQDKYGITGSYTNGGGGAILGTVYIGN